MRIVIAHSRLRTLGGGERVTLELLRRLGRRHEVALWASDFEPDATYRELAAFPRRELQTWQWPLARPAADAVIAQSFGARFLALRHPATLSYVHTLRSRYLLDAHATRPDLAARRALDTLLLRRAAAVAAPSQYVADQLAPRLGRPAEVVAAGVDEAFFEQPAQVGDYALYVGRIAPEKGIARLLEWTAASAVELVVVGTGAADYVAQLRHAAGARVRWLGPMSGVELHRAYAGCRFLLLTPDAEEFGLVVLEAMAAAKPVVATPGGGLGALVEQGKTGWLVNSRSEFETAVAALQCDEQLCRRMGQAGRERARGYTWESTALRIEAICERIREPREPREAPDGTG